MSKKTTAEKLRNQLRKAKLKLGRALPYDPDGKNEMRTAQARNLIGNYRSLTGAKRKNAVSELICDLMHLCDQDNRSRSSKAPLDLAHERYGKQTSEPFS